MKKTTRELLAWIIERLRENSTWRGFILIATALGVAIDPETANAAITAGLSITGLINIFFNRAASKEEVAVAIEKNNVEVLDVPAAPDDQPPKAIVVPEP